MKLQCRERKKTKPSMTDMRNEKWKVKTTKQNNSNNHQAFYLYRIKSSQIEWLRHLKTFLLTFSQTSLKSIRSIIIADDS